MFLFTIEQFYSFIDLISSVVSLEKLMVAIEISYLPKESELGCIDSITNIRDRLGEEEVEDGIVFFKLEPVNCRFVGLYE